MLSVQKVATPATAATVAVPERAPPAGFVPIATVTSPVKPGTGLPAASLVVTRRAGGTAALAVAPLGRSVKPSWVAEPGVIVKEALVAPARPVAVAESL